jgi:hypothetical protein
MLQNPFQDEKHFGLFCSLLQIFKVKVMLNNPFTSIYEGMVLVHKSSILLNIEEMRRKIDEFCYYADQGRECFLMKLSTVC